MVLSSVYSSRPNRDFSSQSALLHASKGGLRISLVDPVDPDAPGLDFAGPFESAGHIIRKQVCRQAERRGIGLLDRLSDIVEAAGNDHRPEDLFFHESRSRFDL